jgi:hypothetical protein
MLSGALPCSLGPKESTGKGNIAHNGVESLSIRGKKKAKKEILAICRK